MQEENGTVTVQAVSFANLLAVAFVILKLVGVIEWSWLWVLAPIWIPACLGIFLLIVLIIASVILDKKSKE
jgi:hypothetical protein